MTKVYKKSDATKLKRIALSERSKKARAFREEQLKKCTSDADALFWASQSINDIVIMWYKEESGATEFKSFFQWKQAGFTVKKGEKAFLLWAKKRKATAKIEVKENEDPLEEEYRFFPLAYVFSDKQVEPIVKEEEPEDEDSFDYSDVEEYASYEEYHEMN